MFTLYLTISMHDIDTWDKKTNLYVEWFNTEVIDIV